MLAPLPSWRKRIAITLTYGVAAVALLGALVLLLLVVPAYRNAAEQQFLTYQSFVTPTALSCAVVALNSAHDVWTKFEQEAQILLGGALLLGGGAIWMRARWRTGRPARPVEMVSGSATGQA